VKKILVIFLIIIVAVFIYININNRPKSSAAFNKQKTIANAASTEETNPPEIPDIYDFSSLTIDSKLKPVKLNIPDSLKWNSPEINISATIPSLVKLCDLFLVINNKKRDMFYRVKGGKYVFKNVKLNVGRSELEIFYRIHKKKSRSATSIIIRE
jgi:hypothetical protein